MTRSGPPGTENEIIESDLDEVVPPAAQGLAAVIFCAVAIVLIGLAPFATRPQPMDKGWYLAPINWPLISLALALVSGAILSWRFWASYRSTEDHDAFQRESLWAFGGMGAAIEYSVYFCIYLVGVSYLGFAIATVLFLQFVAWRSGLRGRKWVLATLVVAIGIVLIFRLGIDLWFPLAPVFKFLPAWVGNTLGGVL
ncbi:tripartite tricarboxylate transporter TctB family protein [Ensifer sp. NBAIM29]|nr:tripartite tricarboxylate transporter TctB family protein [Ensifer sp. NBAIM29]